VFDPRTEAFSATGSMTTARAGAVAAPLPDGRVLIAGGFDSGNELSSAEVYDPSTGTFSPTGR
jgi:Kelch motif